MEIAELHAARLTMLDAGRLLPFLMSVDAQVAQIRGVGKIVDGQFCKRLIFEFGHLNTILARWKIMFLLARHLAGVTTRAVIIIDK